ncbi:MAG: FAD-binding oxidoreductase, partial [Lewinella sp.]|nr:FAD-binding oxidoreductase [Lewinella sp.]
MSILPAPPWADLAAELSGELHTTTGQRIAYATDASVYRSLPQAVVLPRDEADVVATVRFAVRHGLSITPRAGGTSLAGQAIGPGICVDVSRYLTDILEINLAEGWVRVQPGVIREELNRVLEPLGYWFGPNTSTANRCTLGGMFGNNSCGTTSITVGSTREHSLEARCVLADGSTAVFGSMAHAGDGFGAERPGLEGKIYAHILETLAKPSTRATIAAAYPRADIERRNTGYALDLLAKQQPFNPAG